MTWFRHQFEMHWIDASLPLHDQLQAITHSLTPS